MKGCKIWVSSVQGMVSAALKRVAETAAGARLDVAKRVRRPEVALLDAVGLVSSVDIKRASAREKVLVAKRRAISGRRGNANGGWGGLRMTAV